MNEKPRPRGLWPAGHGCIGFTTVSTMFPGGESVGSVDWALRSSKWKRERRGRRELSALAAVLSLDFTFDLGDLSIGQERVIGRQCRPGSRCVGHVAERRKPMSRLGRIDWLAPVALFGHVWFARPTVQTFSFFEIVDPLPELVGCEHFGPAPRGCPADATVATTPR